MINRPSDEQMSKLPKPEDIEHIPFEERLIYLHFSLDQIHFFITAYDGNDLLSGYLYTHTAGQKIGTWAATLFFRKLCDVEFVNDTNWEIQPFYVIKDTYINLA